MIWSVQLTIVTRFLRYLNHLSFGKYDEDPPIRYLRCQTTSFRKPSSHCIRYFCWNNLPIVSHCDYTGSILGQSLTSATLNVNFLIERWVQCKFSKPGFRHLKTRFHWPTLMLSSIMTESWGKVALEPCLKETGMVPRLLSSESAISIQRWVKLWILLDVTHMYLACYKRDQYHETS